MNCMYNMIPFFYTTIYAYMFVNAHKRLLEESTQDYWQ